MDIREKILWMLGIMFLICIAVIAVAIIAGKQQERMIAEFAGNNNCESVVKVYSKLQIEIACRDGRIIHYMR